MEDDLQPQPFERSRNLSNRNFRKLGRRRPSASSISSNDQEAESSPSVQSTSPLQMDCPTPTTPDPALLDVKQKVKHFEYMQDQILFKVGKHLTKGSYFGSPGSFHRQSSGCLSTSSSTISSIYENGEAEPVDAVNPFLGSLRFSTFSDSIDEEHTDEETQDTKPRDDLHNHKAQDDDKPKDNGQDNEADDPDDDDDDDEFSDTDTDDGRGPIEEGQEVNEETQLPMSPPPSPLSPAGSGQSSIGGSMASLQTVAAEKAEPGEKLHRSVSIFNRKSLAKKVGGITDGSKTVGRDFARNFRSKNHVQSQTILMIPANMDNGSTTNRPPDKANSLYETTTGYAAELVGEEEAILRTKCVTEVQKILEELIQTERNYVQNLTMNLRRYGSIFERKDLPDGLRGKKYDLFGNIEQIVEFHRDEFLPMLETNSRDLKRIFDEFQRFIDENCFYSYVLYTMNKKTSLKLFENYVKYFKLIENEINDPLGINSFLVEPIQRMPRYSLLLVEFIKKLFENSDYAMKPVIKSCCSLEVKLRNLLHKVNNSEIVNDIVNCHEVDIHLQGKFCKVDEFTVSDHTLKRSYRSKVFIFDKCIIYTEIKDKQLIFRGRYPCEHVGIDPKPKHLTLYYEKRKQQECDFFADPKTIEAWIELLRTMVSNFLKEERQKLQELYTNKSDHYHRKPPSLSLYRDSNRFSSDSGIGNIWVLPKVEVEVNDPLSNNRTTWYTDR